MATRLWLELRVTINRIDIPIAATGSVSALPLRVAVLGDKITLTHDPAGAFLQASEGIVFAGHTHCGQVRLPFVGALWVQTSAPDDATCGLYQDADRTLYVTSGVGTSLFPLRLGAPSARDIVELKKR